MSVRKPIVTLDAPGYVGSMDGRGVPLPDGDSLDVGGLWATVETAAGIKGMAYGYSSAGKVARLIGDTGTRCLGLLSAAVAQDAIGKLVSSGPFVMSVVEWQAVTNDAAALTPGDIYYGSLATPGKLFHGVIASTHLALQIGIALDATTLVLQIAPPVTVP